jgi:RHS repeat-associated protein
MAGISSKAVGKMDNKRKFNAGSELQNNEFSDASGLEIYDTKFRGLDPQIGRWLQIDPHAEYHLGSSPYNYVLNNPLLYNDPYGLDTVRIHGSGKFNIKVREGDVLAWQMADNTVSYYTYSPNSEGAVNGFVGNGIQSSTMDPVEVTAKSKSQSGSNNYSFSWMAALGTGASAGEYLLHNKSGWYSLKQNKFYSPRFHGNQYTGGRVKFAKTNSVRLARVGYGLGVWGAYDINRQYLNDEISGGQMRMEQASNLISTVGGIYGAGWGVGWETGRYVTSIPWYRANIRPLVQDALGAERDEVPKERNLRGPESSNR